MGKKKTKKSNSKSSAKNDEYRESNEHFDGLEMDHTDEYEAMQDAQIMSKLKTMSKRNVQDTSGGFEELYALSGDSDSDDDADEGHEFADDVDDEEADVRAWGNKKKHFYGGNPNDSRANDADNDDELEEAKAEEAEGKLLQKAQLDKLDDEDFFDMFTTSEAKIPEDRVNDQVAFDIKQLSKKERVALFNKESPEFHGILQDFQDQMQVLVEYLQPVINLSEENENIANGPAMHYVQVKYKLILNYCVNILAYVMFKTKNVNVKLHPLTKRIVQFKQMLDQLAPLDQHMEPKMQDLLENQEPVEPVAVEKNPKKKLKNKKKLQILTKKVEKKAKTEDLTMDEKIALEVYGAMKSKKKENILESDDEETEQVQEPENEDEEMDGEEAEERRAITYQIAKNKGLQPKRNKVQRNPRVKHRMKFEKAKVRRKGQVREVRKEVKRYAGEMSGINMRVKKGIKLS